MIDLGQAVKLGEFRRPNRRGILVKGFLSVSAEVELAESISTDAGAFDFARREVLADIHRQLYDPLREEILQLRAQVADQLAFSAPILSREILSQFDKVLALLEVR